MEKLSDNRIYGLTEQLNRYRHEYYNLNAPSVSDEVYDRLFDELAGLEKETGIKMSNSPTQSVGYNVVSSLAKIQHNIPLLSLEKTKSSDDLLKFIGVQPVMAMLKLDGLTVELEYENGELLCASTRGNGEEGEDITHNMRAVAGVPSIIQYKNRLVVTGEAYITDNDFDELKDTLTDSNGEPYSNSRNLAAGSVRCLDSAVCAERRVRFTPFNVLEGLDENAKIANSKHTRLNFLEAFGFSSCERYLLINPAKNELEQKIDLLRETAKSNGTPIDGIVVTYDNVEYSRACGSTSHHNKDGLAFKFEDGLHETQLLSIEWTPSRTGEITPVAVFETVIIDGCEVSRASLHNLTFIKELELMPGCRILVSKRNMIIPHVEKNLDRGLFTVAADYSKVPIQKRLHWMDNIRICETKRMNNECDGDDSTKEEPNKRSCTLCVKRRARDLHIIIESVIPSVCPCCGAPTRINVSGKENDRIIETLYCDNPECAVRRLRQFIHFSSKKALDIEGLSEATLEKFIGRGWLKSFADVYRLDRYKAEIIDMEGFGEKSYAKLWNAIEKSKTTTFERFVVALDIPMIGSTASKELNRVFDGDLDTFDEAVYIGYDFTQLKDFGETLHTNIHEWFRESENMDLLKELRKVVTIEKKETVPVDPAGNPFAGKTVVATGTLANFTRSGINEKIESLGAKAGDSISKNTDYLIYGDKAGSKLEKARLLGVIILTEQQFLEMIGE